MKGKTSITRVFRSSYYYCFHNIFKSKNICESLISIHASKVSKRDSLAAKWAVELWIIYHWVARWINAPQNKPKASSKVAKSCRKLLVPGKSVASTRRPSSQKASCLLLLSRVSLRTAVKPGHKRIAWRSWWVRNLHPAASRLLRPLARNLAALQIKTF